MKLYERFDTDYASLTSYRICCILHKVALRAVHNALYEVQLPEDAVVITRRPNTSQTPVRPITLSLSEIGDEDRPEAVPSEVSPNIQQEPENTWPPYHMPDLGLDWTAPFGLQSDFWQYFPTWTDVTDEPFDFTVFGIE
jgi:hypothetical protein